MGYGVEYIKSVHLIGRFLYGKKLSIEFYDRRSYGVYKGNKN